MKVDKNLKISMSRGQLRDMLTAVDVMTETEAGHGAKWYHLYVELSAALADFDRIKKERRQKHNARRAKRPFGGFQV